MQQKQCACTNGVAASGKECPKNGEALCAKCNFGFELKNGSCSACPSGTYAKQGGSTHACVDCRVDHAKSYSEGCIVSECDSGFTPNDNRSACRAFTGNCQNGKELARAKRTKDDQCGSCDSGYYLNGDQCNKNQCACPNGVGATGKECPKNGETLCKGCNAGSN